MRGALIANFAFASVVLAASSVTLHLLVPAIGTEVQQKVAYGEIINKAETLDAESQKNMERKTAIEKSAIYDIWMSGFGMMQKFFAAMSALFGCIVGYRALRKSKTEANGTS